jgi:ABC-2 type transport system ATP-binding protein
MVFLNLGLDACLGCQLQESALPDRIRVWEALDLFASLGSPGGRSRGRDGDAGGGRRDAGEGRGAGEGREAGQEREAEGGGGRSGDPSWPGLLEQWGLTAKRRASFGSLSGGQRQRLFVALALVNHPRVVFLDEMTTGLDPAARRVAWDLIRAIRDQGATVVLVTHFMDEAERLCDRLAIMKAGQIVALDSPQGLISTHADRIRMRFGWSDAADAAGGSSFGWLREVPHVHEVRRVGSRLEVTGTGPVVPLVAAALVERGHVPADLQVEQPSLEDVFLKLTGEPAPDAVSE